MNLLIGLGFRVRFVSIFYFPVACFSNIRAQFFPRLLKNVLRCILYGARGRPLRGVKKLAPLAKRSTCSKSKFFLCLLNLCLGF